MSYPHASMRDMDPDARCERLAVSQHGVVSRAQALLAGVTGRVVKTRLASGRWEQVYRGVYRVIRMPPSWHQRLISATLYAGPRALASHRAAAALWHLDEAKAPPLEISVPSGRRIPGVLVHRLRPEDQPERVVIDGIPTTGIERTLLDLAASSHPALVGRALDGALRERLTTLPELWASLPPPGRAGRRVLRQLLEERDERDQAVESELEQRLLHLLRRSGLPLPNPQHRVTEEGRFVARLDFAYPAYLLGIEVDGYRWHSGAERWRQDLRRENRLKLLGWTLLRFSWHDVRNQPNQVVEQIRSALRRFGQGSLC